MEVETAASVGVEFLYHYQRFNPDRLKELLKNQSIFLTVPSNFNDPWDCRPYFDFSLLDDPDTYERQVQWFDRVGRRYATKVSEEEHYRRMVRLRSDRSFLEGLIREMATISDEMDRRYRVYCLTPNPISTLMWSHYSERHTGICLGFRCSNTVFGSAHKVQYLDTFPLIDLADESTESNLLPFLAKSADWSYEDEYRLVAQEESEMNFEGTLLTQNNLLPLPMGALAIIIFGCLMSDSDRRSVCQMVADFDQEIEVMEAIRVQDRYQLKLERA